MAKKGNDYFELLKQQTSYCVAASELLNEILRQFHSDSVSVYRSQMHKLETTADELRHDILKKLSTEFITPIDQEDILRLVQIIDDITDALDEVILDVFMYRIDTISEQTEALCEIVNRCVKALYRAVEELSGFKKPELLHSLLKTVNDIEAEADQIYADAIHKLFGSTDDCKTLLGVKTMYESLEDCCDLCEHAADVIELLIIKNT